MKCPQCASEVLEIDVKCAHCGAALAATGAHRMIGSTVLGQYVLVDVIGQGGMSVVFKARHGMTEQEVALKILPPELAAHSQVKSRFLEEAKALAALDHPNIVHLYNFGQENGSFVLAMQFVDGRTWERLILERERLDWKVSCRIAIDVLKALEYAHGRGVIHRDMKPSNVLVRAHDGLATVMDFGIAKMTTSTKLTATGQTMGTVRYMSPEQVRGQEVDLRTDIYSLGASLYESLVGDTPFDGETHFEIMTKHLSEAPKRPSSRGVELPPMVEDAVLKSMSKKPEDRFDNARDMRKLLEAALREADVGLVETQRLQREILGELRKDPNAPMPRPATANDLADQLEPQTAARPTRRSRWPWLAGAGVLVAGGATAAVLVLGGGHGRHKKPRPGAGELVIVPGAGATLADGDTSYRRAFEQLGKSVSEKFPHVTIERPVDKIVLVSRAELCDPKRYGDIPVPPGCDSLTSSVSASTPRTLLVATDGGHLQQGMDEGLATALCLFQSYAIDGDPDAAGKKQMTNAICDFASHPLGKDR